MHEIKLNCTFFDPLRWLRFGGIGSFAGFCSIDWCLHNYWSKFQEKSFEKLSFTIFSISQYLLYQMLPSSLRYSSLSATNFLNQRCNLPTRLPIPFNWFSIRTHNELNEAPIIYDFLMFQKSGNVKHQKEFIFSLTFMDHLLTLCLI